jgi:putative SOS response-associated peptidase YedK
MGPDALKTDRTARIHSVPCVVAPYDAQTSNTLPPTSTCTVHPFPTLGPSWNIAPQTFQPIVRLNRDSGQREIVLMRWGLVPFWSKDERIGVCTINAKVETVTTAPAFP